MSPEPELHVVVEPLTELAIALEATPTVIVAATPVDVPIVAAANVGPQGPAGAWTQITQAAYDALPDKDPDVLYVIIG